MIIHDCYKACCTLHCCWVKYDYKLLPGVRTRSSSPSTLHTQLIKEQKNYINNGNIALPYTEKATRNSDAICKLMVSAQRGCTGTTREYSMRYVSSCSSCSLNIISQSLSENFSSRHIQTRYLKIQCCV